MMVVTQEIRIEDERIPERARTTRAKESNTAKPSEPFVGVEGSDAKQGRERGWIGGKRASHSPSRLLESTHTNAGVRQSRSNQSKIPSAWQKCCVQDKRRSQGERGLNENTDQAQGSQRKGVPERLNMTPRIVILLSFFRLPFSRTDRQCLLRTTLMNGDSSPHR